MPGPKEIAGGHFRDISPAWPQRVASTAPPATVAAAWLQFRLASAVWREISEGNTDLKHVGSLLGESAENQRRKLAGESWASLDDILGWALAYTDLSDFKVRDVMDLFPQSMAPRIRTYRPGGHLLPDLTLTAGPDWSSLTATVCARIADQSVGGTYATLTPEVVNHVLALALVSTGLEPERIISNPAPGRTTAGLDLRLPGARVRVDAVVLHRAVAEVDPELAFLAALARSSGSGADHRVLLTVVPPGGLQPWDYLGVTRPQTDLTKQRLSVGPIEVPVETSPQLATWWARNTADLLIAGAAQTGGVQMWALEVEKLGAT